MARAAVLAPEAEIWRGALVRAALVDFGGPAAVFLVLAGEVVVTYPRAVG